MHLNEITLKNILDKLYECQSGTTQVGKLLPYNFEFFLSGNPLNIIESAHAIKGRFRAIQKDTLYNRNNLFNQPRYVFDPKPTLDNNTVAKNTSTLLTASIKFKPDNLLDFIESKYSKDSYYTTLSGLSGITKDLDIFISELEKKMLIADNTALNEALIIDAGEVDKWGISLRSLADISEMLSDNKNYYILPGHSISRNNKNISHIFIPYPLSKFYLHNFNNFKTALSKYIKDAAKAKPDKNISIAEFSQAKSWQDIEIKFKNQYDVEIKIKGKPYNTGYEKLGFADLRKDPKKVTAANAAWSMLGIFAAQSGILPLPAGQKEKNLVHKNKQQLSNILKNIFPNAPGDPISASDQKYTINIKLIPEPTFRELYEDKKKGIIDADKKFLPKV